MGPPNVGTGPDAIEFELDKFAGRQRRKLFPKLIVLISNNLKQRLSR